MPTNTAPEEQGLQYKALAFSHLRKPVWLLKDQDAIVWVDVRSVIEALGMSWQRWHLLIKMHRKAWGFDSCLDRHALETELVPEIRFIRWLNEINSVLRSYPRHVEERAKLLRGSWQVRYTELLQQEYPDIQTASEAGSGRKRKITPEIVIRLHHQRCVIGASITSTAKNLEIGVSTVKAIEAGTYKFWTPDAREAWRQTFGTAHKVP